MKAILLDGSLDDDMMGERVSTALAQELRGRGWEVEHMQLRDRKIGNCAGDFFCWVRKPGMCNVDDDNRIVAESVVNSDLMVYLTPVTFGGYSSALKKAVDHQIQNIAPFFARVNGETHHAPRYGKYPDFLAVGWQETPDEQAGQVFSQLTGRNAINFYAKNALSGVVQTTESDGEILAKLRSWLDQLQNGCGHAVRQPAAGEQPIPGTVINALPIKRALLLVGSPRTRNSTSHSLGGYLFDKLAENSVQTETIYIHTSLRSKEKMSALYAAVEAADLVLLAFPLYVDSLPSPVIEGLERIAAQRKGQPGGKLFAAIANCGFPEAQHNETALAICATFARQAGFEWAGSLALGAGEGMVHGAALKEMDGRVTMLRKALDLAALSLARGEAIPAAAQALLAKPFIPAWLYRLVGSLGWDQQAKGWGMNGKLKNQPYIHIKL